MRESIWPSTRSTSRQSDRLDFHDLAVWSIEQALEAAFQAGLAAAEDRRRAWGEELLGQAQNAEASELAYPGRGIFAQVLTAMQDAEEIGGPEKSDYLDLMVAIIHEASERISCYASHAFEEYRSEVRMTIATTNHGGDQP